MLSLEPTKPTIYTYPRGTFPAHYVYIYVYKYIMLSENFKEFSDVLCTIIIIIHKR